MAAVGKIIERNAEDVRHQLRGVHPDANGEQHGIDAIAEQRIDDPRLVVSPELLHSSSLKLTRSRSMTSGVPRVRSEIARICTPTRPKNMKSRPNWSSSSPANSHING